MGHPNTNSEHLGDSVTEEEIARLVKEWHTNTWHPDKTGEKPPELWEYLGWTFEEYCAWVEDETKHP